MHMHRFGHAHESAGAPQDASPVHVILRAPDIRFPADSPINMVDEGCRTVERLSLHADTFHIGSRTRSASAIRPA